MQNPTDQAETSIPTESVRESPNLNRPFTVRQKAAKRSERWYQSTSAPLSTSARKKPRLDDTLPTTTDEADRNDTTAPGISIGLLPPITDTDDANVDLVMDIQSNARATGATGRWTAEEDAELTSAVANTKKKWWGKEYKIDWVAIAPLVASRTKQQCHQRWRDFVDPSIALTARRRGTWVEEEDSKLIRAIDMHGGKNWDRISALVPSRTKVQCYNRWYDVLDPSIALATGRTGKWTEEEDSKLMHAVQTHGGKNWDSISALVPGRAQIQCRNRWHNVVHANLDRTPGRKGSWTEDEVIKLKSAVQLLRGKDWAAIAALVPGRTRSQCWGKWQADAVESSLD
jgi:hypothetical protein